MKVIRTWSKAWRLFVLYRAISALPMPLSYMLSGLFSPLDRSFSAEYFTQWKKGLERCSRANPILEDMDLHRCSREHERMLSMEVVDTYLVPRLSADRMKMLSTVVGLEHLKAAHDRGKGVIVVTSHFCRLNMTAYSLGKLGIRNGILSQYVGPDNPHLDWAESRFLSWKLKNYYQVTGGPGITLRDNPRKILRALERNEIMVILIDAFPHGVKRFLQVPFLNGVLDLPQGIARISRKTGSPLVYSVVKPAGRWKVRVELRPIGEGAEEGFFQAASELEKDVKQLPCQWWQWAYMNSMWRSQEGHGG